MEFADMAIFPFRRKGVYTNGRLGINQHHGENYTSLITKKRRKRKRIYSPFLHSTESVKYIHCLQIFPTLTCGSHKVCPTRKQTHLGRLRIPLQLYGPDLWLGGQYGPTNIVDHYPILPMQTWEDSWFGFPFVSRPLAIKKHLMITLFVADHIIRF